MINVIGQEEKIKLSASSMNKMNSDLKINNNSLTIPSTRKPYIFVKSSKCYTRIPYGQILYVKASGAYCDIVLCEKSYTISTCLNNVLTQLDTDLIIRCHRSFAVNIDMISSFDDTTINLSSRTEKITLPISMTYRSRVLELLPRLKS